MIINNLTNKPQLFTLIEGNYLPTSNVQGSVVFSPESTLKLSATKYPNKFSQEEVAVARGLGFQAIALVNQYGDIQLISPLIDDVVHSAENRFFGEQNEFNLKNMYHGTNQFFHCFSESTDIGFHFGNKSAALSRMKAISRPSTSIQKLEYGSVDLFQKHTDNLEHENPIDRAFAVLMTRLHSPKPNLKTVLESMSPDELIELIEEYKGKPFSSAYEDSIKNSGKSTEYTVCLDGDAIAAFDTAMQAKAASEVIKTSMLKLVDISLINPLRLPDLGLWSAYDIAVHSGFDREEIAEVLSLSDDHEQYLSVIQKLEQRGYDGIVYRNEVENAGSDSYIVFRKNQILEKNAFKLPLSLEKTCSLSMA